MDTVWLLGSSSQLDTLQISVVHYWSVDTIWLLPFQLDTLHCRSLLVCGHRMTTALSAGHSSDQSRSLLVCGHRMTTALLAGHSSDQSYSLLVCGHRMTTAFLAGHSSPPFITGLCRTPYDYCLLSWLLFIAIVYTTGMTTGDPHAETQRLLRLLLWAGGGLGGGGVVSSLRDFQSFVVCWIPSGRNFCRWATSIAGKVTMQKNSDMTHFAWSQSHQLVTLWCSFRSCVCMRHMLLQWKTGGMDEWVDIFFCKDNYCCYFDTWQFRIRPCFQGGNCFGLWAWKHFAASTAECAIL